ncbi:unnamed protein product [Allacma fusca]|uniref:Uncharacterized protein n=1 Tax=Allacma fusca TaxID=39272 RepID=A0A8J2LBV4_9HEXA|nr:unnamed protein product [Allacma fusca]
MLIKILTLSTAILVIGIDLTNGGKDSDRFARILERFEKPHTGDGTYSFGFKTSNGISMSEKGVIKNPEAPKSEQITVKGGCSYYMSPEGAFISLIYTADERGFRPKTRITHPRDALKYKFHMENPCRADLTIPKGYGTEGFNKDCV